VAMLRAVGDALIRAGESGKRRGWVSREEAQYLAATPQGWFDGPTLGWMRCSKYLQFGGNMWFKLRLT